MRNIRSRIALFFNVKTSAALDQVEDPREILDYAYGQQQFHLRTVKRGLIEVAAARRQLERQAERLRARVTQLDEQARVAAERPGEDEGQHRKNDNRQSIAQSDSRLSSRRQCC